MTEGRYRGHTKGTHFYFMLVDLHFVLEVSLGAFSKSREPSGSLCHGGVCSSLHILWAMHADFTCEILISNETASLENLALYLHRYFLVR